MKRIVYVVAVSAAAVATAASPADAARSFSNCTSLNKTYKHGVGKPGARDRTSGTRVTTFKRSRALYKANSSKDRDGDGIACEKA